MVNLLIVLKQHTLNVLRKSILVFLVFITQNIIAQPFINSFNPLSGPAGSIDTIKGHGFNDIVEKNIVYFGAARGSILSNNSLILFAIVFSRYFL